MTKIKILGCSGGIGDSNRTTSLLIDDDVLIDAGTGVGDLSLAELVKIDHVFLTHTHLDHIALLPLMLDTVIGLRSKPVTVHASVHAINVLKQHIFNWLVWPNFNLIPDPATPFLIYDEIILGDSFKINGKTITVLPANHVVPAFGYQVDGKAGSLVFTGDTAGSQSFWNEVNMIKNLKYLIIETAFSNAEAGLAALSKHLCPNTLALELENLKAEPKVFVTHLKPGEDEKVMQEIKTNPKTQHCKALQHQQVLSL